MKDIIDQISQGAVGQGTEIQAGECISSIAFRDDRAWDKIWNHADNKDLKDKRLHPNILLPGDKVTVPDIEPLVEDEDVDDVHVYTRRGIPCGFQLRFTQFGKPREDEPYEVWKDKLKLGEGQLNDNGILELDMILPNWDKITVFIGENKDAYDFELGTIAPITEPRGIQARLWNLGYYHDELTDDLTPATESAFRRFMNKNGILDKISDDLSKEAVKSGLALLVTVHGC